MGFLDDAVDAAKATGKKVGEWADDTVEAAGDKVDEVKADLNVARADAEKQKAEKERDATLEKNEYKEELRES